MSKKLSSPVLVFTSQIIDQMHLNLTLFNKFCLVFKHSPTFMSMIEPEKRVTSNLVRENNSAKVISLTSLEKYFLEDISQLYI